MLKLRPSRQTEGGARRRLELKFDIRDGDQEIGKLVYDHQQSRGAFNIGEDGFVVERIADPEVSPEAAPKPASPVFSLKNAGGALLARAERDREVFVVGRDGESFILQAGRSRLYFHLQREGDVVTLGGVGQRKFWTSSLEINLPDGFTASFQVFLASLLLDLIAPRPGGLTT